jgi:LmbE family N-acetylglucosaminyl deacetylase
MSIKGSFIQVVVVAAVMLSARGELFAQQLRPAASDKIYGDIARLRNLVNVLYVAAHPDDENTRLLAWLVNDRHIRTAYLSLTRGDGGQNILGSEQGEALGLIRTHELIEARKLDGAEQYFSRAIDFGFSKTHEETFKHWPEYLLTYDAVWVMRKYRPDVVICRFPPNTMAGHGQHAASAVIAAKAFKATGDKMQYTEQLRYYKEWQPKRLLLNTYKFGDRNTTSEDQFKLGVGQYLPTFGEGCGELAGRSRSIHKSQGAGTPSTPGVQTEYFKYIDGDSLSQSFFDGIDITWGRVGRTDIGDDLKKIEERFDFLHPDASIPALLEVRKKIQSVADEYWRKQKLEEIDRVILDCTGLMAELYAKQPQAVRGATLPFTLRVIARSHTPFRLDGISWGNGDTTTNLSLPYDTLLTFEHAIAISKDEPFTQPYWLSKAHPDADMFAIPHDTLLGLPETPNNLNASLMLNIGGIDIPVKVPLSYKKLDPVKGDIVEQLRIVPDVSVAFNTTLLITKPDGPVQAEVRLHAYKNLSDGVLTISGTKSDVAVIKKINLAEGTDTFIIVNIDSKLSAKQDSGDYYLSVSFTANNKTYDKALHLIQYNHLPTLQYFTNPVAKVVRANWKRTVTRVGYVEGAGDYIPTFLRQAGIEVDVLKESDLENAVRLKKYDAIITGIRAVNVEKRMAYWLPVLMQYVQNGGTLLMQYNTMQDMATTKLGPYPITLSHDRVTEEDAKVEFTDPKSRLLSYPNKITDKDFDGWVQERGLYFAKKWDDNYKPLFAMHDAGEQPLTGGTLYAKYGKGNYIYTSLSFSRQIPAGNKGAIRLLMNMLSPNPKGSN